MTLTQAREELSRGCTIPADMAFEEDGTPNYPYLFGYAISTLTGIQGHIESAKERENVS